MNAITEFMSKPFSTSSNRPEVIAARQEFAREQMDAIARQEAAFRLAPAHADALDDNAIIDDAVRTAHEDAMDMDYQITVREQAADLARCTANAAALLADARSPIAESVSAYHDAGLSAADLSDDDIIEFGAEWEMDLPALVARLEEFCVRARDVMGVAA